MSQAIGCFPWEPKLGKEPAPFDVSHGWGARCLLDTIEFRVHPWFSSLSLSFPNWKVCTIPGLPHRMAC